MSLSALEIKKKEFTQKMRGADPEEVQAFLDQVSAEVEALTIEKKESEERLAIVIERLDHYASLEQTIEKTLAAAQQTAVIMQEQAKREADLILRDAELERNRKLNDARIEQNRLESDVVRLRSEYQSLLSRMRATTDGFNSYLRTMEQDVAPISTSAIDAVGVIELHESRE
ncbi:MAG TPA: DivIVA domain-containing protein [Candidatus Kapabacteria bacterium]|nr:DivIVA domain-containing protein [Candidatus Kapabacteria bacterium]